MSSFTLGRRMAVIAAMAIVLAGLVLGGCASSGPVVVDPSNRNPVTTKPEPQDFKRAADDMLQSLKGNAALERAARKPSVIAFGRILNDTSTHLDPDALTMPIMESIQASNIGVLHTTMGTGGDGSRARSALAEEIARWKEFNKGEPLPERFPDFILDGKIFQHSVAGGNVRQNTYYFQLILTDVRTGTSAWMAQRDVTKQQKQKKFGL